MLRMYIRGAAKHEWKCFCMSNLIVLHNKMLFISNYEAHNLEDVYRKLFMPIVR